MKRFRSLGSKVWRAATEFAQLITWPLRSFPFLVSPFYPRLKWFVRIALASVLFGLITVYIAEEFDPRVWKAVTRFVAAHQSPFLLALGLFLIFYFLAWVGHKRRETQRCLRAAFGIYLPAEKLSLADLGFRESQPEEPERWETHLQERPFFGTYFPRTMIEDEDTESTDADTGMRREFTEEDLQEHIRDGRRFLLLDHLYSGKTLTLFHIVRRMRGYTVVSPDDSQPLPDEETFALLKGRRVVILLDNLAALAESNYNLVLFVRRVAEATRNRYGVAATCREGGAFTAIAAGHGNYVTYFHEQGLLKLRLCPMTSATLVELAATSGMLLDPKDARKFPLPGNITMRVQTQTMKVRFDALPEPSKDALRALKLLDTGGVPLTIPRFQIVLRGVFHRSIEQNRTEDVLRNLWDQFFLLEQPSMKRLHPHFGYLGYAVSYSEGREPEDERWDNLAQALEKARDVEALVHLGHGHRRRGDLVRCLQMFDGVLRIDPEHASANFHRGYTLARLGQFKEALEANARALEFRPDFAEAYNNRSYILSGCGQFSSALDAVQRALELRPDFEDAHTNRAIVLARLGRFKEAQQEFSTALGLRPESSYAYLNMGITLSRQGASNEALIAYEQALKLRPRYPEAHFNRGITLARMGRFDNALADFARAIELRSDYAEAHMHRGQTLANLQRYPEAIQALNRAIELKRDYALAYVNRARTFAHMGPECREAASRDWQTASALGAVPEQRNLVLGVSLAHQGEFSKALDIFDRVIKLRPDYAEAYMNRAITLARMGMDRFDDALADFDHAIELRPDYAAAHMNRGQTLARMGMDRFDDALADFDRAIELRPDYAAAYMNRGQTLAQRDRFDDALADFDRAIKLRPDYAEAYMNRAITLARMGMDRFDDALADFDRAIELRPDYPAAHMNRGQTLARMGMERFEDSLADFDRAIELRPDYAEAHMNRAITLSQRDRFDDALADFDRAIELRPDYPDAYMNRGITLSQRDWFDDALADFDRAIELHPDYPEAHCGRGRALANLRRHDEALQSVGVALRLRPEFAEAYSVRGFVLNSIRGFDRIRLKQALSAYDEAIRLQPDYPQRHYDRGFTLGRLGHDEEALAAFNQAIELRSDYAEALFGKARTLCFLARNNPQRFPLQESFGEAIGLLERAIAIDNSIIGRITRDHSAFCYLRDDPGYGPRLSALVWETGH